MRAGKPKPNFYVNNQIYKKAMDTPYTFTSFYKIQKMYFEFILVCYDYYY